MSYDLIKAERGLCLGNRTGLNGKCNGQTFRCECGHVGCRQTYDDACTGQAFSAAWRCVNCGAVGKVEALNFENRIGA
ncbi:hypothetical protein [Methyloversatilis sp.]|uniref:hypothetical protein n=1 Tax=Methyloversatilis sp. TaxID=2569862 RepID=UPI002736E504|nr:hypothetical protein [Methyloversatilis sp.]MDP2870736.1 hypothetical protein [Methyloversatilis sp.]MDP3455571.1 hypothetical protein [Methyloversatilis sp.]MDP3578186.1 hypothetical protein [Methyloversatilis sp.]